MDSKALKIIKEKNGNQPFTMTQVIRHALQIAGFLLLPGLFILTLGSLKGLWQAIIGGRFTWAALGAPLLTLLAVIPVTVLWGRFFCGYLCAFGGMQELLRFAGRKLKLPEISVSPAVDRILRKMKYVVLAGLFLLWTFDIAYDDASPWNIFGRYATYDGWTDLSGWMTVGGVLLVLTASVSLFAERAFCRYFCPLGGLFSLISRRRLFNVKKNHKCVGCGRCDAACPMGIAVSHDTGAVSSPECIDCFRCLDSCESKALYTAPREAVAGSAAALAVAGLYQVGTVAVRTPLAADVNGVSLSQGKYIDGTYEGSAQGYRGTVTVQVKVSGGMISSVTVESYQDDSEFFNRAKDTVIHAIIAGQTTDVQTVSGATYSSRGIMQAVANALGVTTQSSGETLPSSDERGGSQEKRQRPENNGENDNDGNHQKNGRKAPSDNSSAPHSSDTNSDAAPDFTNLADGTYSGTGRGRNGSIAVSVKVKGGKVVSITVESSREDEAYFSRAKDTVIDEIIDSQSLHVQTVSGATMSSNGIIDAVANALGISYTNPNSQTGTNPSHDGGHSRNRGGNRRH